MFWYILIYPEYSDISETWIRRKIRTLTAISNITTIRTKAYQYRSGTKRLKSRSPGVEKRWLGEPSWRHGYDVTTCMELRHPHPPARSINNTPLLRVDDLTGDVMNFQLSRPAFHTVISRYFWYGAGKIKLTVWWVRPLRYGPYHMASKTPTETHGEIYWLGFNTLLWFSQNRCFYTTASKTVRSAKQVPCV